MSFWYTLALGMLFGFSLALFVLAALIIYLSRKPYMPGPFARPDWEK